MDRMPWIRARRVAVRGLRRLGLGPGQLASRRFVGPASFWAPEHLVQSSWLQHAPFAFWLIGVARPASVVELGTHRGFSYLVFCQAIRDHRLRATAHAVDTWEGDEHAGYYGDEVLTQLRRLHDDEYSSFSTLIRSSFSDAASRFGEGSIDLLHIDGLHTYDAVKTDFETWKPKLSDRGIVLFHDTNEFTPGFGVHRFWAEIREEYQSFAFLHCSGLGVLLVGKNVPRRVQELAAITPQPRVVDAVRHRYEVLGSKIVWPGA
jgi:Methyltransferase domain